MNPNSFGLYEKKYICFFDGPLSPYYFAIIKIFSSVLEQRTREIVRTPYDRLVERVLVHKNTTEANF